MSDSVCLQNRSPSGPSEFLCLSAARRWSCRKMCCVFVQRLPWLSWHSEPNRVFPRLAKYHRPSEAPYKCSYQGALVWSHNLNEEPSFGYGWSLVGQAKIPDTNHRSLARANEPIVINIDRKDPVAEAVCLVVCLPVSVRLEAVQVELVFGLPFL